ncbi:probable 2-oxoglutarate-dependent dioxygenase AOP1 [Vicia villosa]|uniref:probable 2-oxoglutarate-dependent dioxygenase AOP1 n=1 Tax=Vicia villosa TaxID=3911 RepID=UPI00273B5954|nr:probable 2-oxoglutarate-dependent dioxygenase AOP1 [Vicia villosa]
MDSQTSQKLPAIDFTNINLANRELVKSQVYQALVEYGCFEATFDKIPLHLRKAMFDAIQELFDLPLEIKTLDACKMNHQGYVGQTPVIPLFESLGIDHANIFQRVDTITNTWWPQGNPSFSKTINSFSVKLAELDETIRKMVLESLGVEKYIEEHMKSTDYLLRVMKYKSPQTNDKKLGLVPHTDQTLVTILYQNQVGGLEVMTKDEKWISFKPSSPHSFLVLVGDSFKAWSNGRLHSPFHRVMMSGNETRYSLGLFTLPKKGCIVNAPDELVDEEHPLLFKPYDFVEFLNYRYSEEGFRDPFSLRTYCGV